MTMTDAQWAYLEAYVTDVAQRLGLGHWRLIFSREPCADNHYADITASALKWEAVIRFKADVATATPEKVRETVVHELLHVHTADIVDALTIVRENVGAGAIWAAFYYAHDKAEERAVDALARLIAPFMPEYAIPQEAA